MASMVAPLQGSLFGGFDDIRLDQGVPVHRTPLAHGAWVDLRAGWLRGADNLFDRLADTVPWHAEQRTMYERVVEVPRLLCFYDETDPLPDPILSEARTHSVSITAPNWVNRSTPSVCASTAMAATAWHGTATPSAVEHIRTLWSPSSPSAQHVHCCYGHGAAARACVSIQVTATCW